MIFQEPMTSLNPLYTVGDQIAEMIRLHERAVRRRGAAAGAADAGLVEIPAADRRLDDYPHQMSGGMRQRVMIALALVLQSVAAHRRRADDRARRDDPGADPRPAAPPAARARHEHPVRHAQSRRRRRDRARGRGHVCRPRGRGRRRSTALFEQPEASLHAGPARLHPRTRARDIALRPAGGCGSSRSRARCRA